MIISSRFRITGMCCLVDTSDLHGTTCVSGIFTETKKHAFASESVYLRCLGDHYRAQISPSTVAAECIKD